MSQRRTKSKMLPEFEFKVNVRYDQEFRSRDANQRLRKNHPKVKKIHVKPRDDAKKSRDGNSYVKVIIAAPTREIAKACFDEGNARVLKRQGNNSRRPRTNSRRTKTNRKQRTNSRRIITRRITNNRNKILEKHLLNQKLLHQKIQDRFIIFPRMSLLRLIGENSWTRCDEYQKKHPEVKVIC